MIVTVTPSPSLDRTLFVESLTVGDVVRAQGSRVDAGGKGVNVSRALAANGVGTHTVLPTGGPEGARQIALLASAGVEVAAVPIAENTRSNISIVEPDGTVTKVNEPGPKLGRGDVEAILNTVADLAPHAQWIIGSGSLPHGTPVEFYARLVELAHGFGVRVALDSSGPALAAGVRHAPELVKPNAEELAELVGRRLTTFADVLEAAQYLRELGVRAVLVSLGRDGAILLDEDQAVHGESVISNARSSVGAGDALLAGFLAAGGCRRGALAEGLAWAGAACLLPGTGVPDRTTIDRSVVTLSDFVASSRRLSVPPRNVIADATASSD